MNTPSRKHHFLSRAYLAEFTESGLQSGKFFVLDCLEKRNFKTSPQNVAAERDFNRVNISNKASDIVEGALSGPEGVFAEALKNVKGGSSFPSDEDRNALMNLMALIAANGPKTRNTLHTVQEKLFQQYSAAILSDKDLFEATWSRNKNPAKEEENASFEEISREIQPKNLRLKPSTHNSIVFAMDYVDDLLKVFDKRFWTLFSTPPGGPEFICSDHPVTLWSRHESRLWTNGHGVFDTEIFFPLNRTQGLFGIFENQLPSCLDVSSLCVADLNARTHDNADKQVYSAQESFSKTVNGRIEQVSCRPS